METLPGQFADALTKIEVNGTKQARAIAAHVEVRALLETSGQLNEWGVDTVLIGSYKRNTGVHPGNDVDVFTKFTKLDTDVSPAEVFGQVCDILTDHYRERAEPQTRSVKIHFSDDGFSVDVVPAVRSDNQWAIPANEREVWGGSSARWVVTDPERLSELTLDANKKPQVNDQGAYVPVVKLMRQARKHHRGDARPRGLYIELATYDAFRNGIIGDSFAELFAATLSAVAGRLGTVDMLPLLDPALGTAYQPVPDPDDVAAAASLFSNLAEQAAQALEADRCQAAFLWRQVLGHNDRGVVFPLPPGCDETGKEVPAVTANRGRGSNEARGFG
jgi:hypothetical protein